MGNYSVQTILNKERFDLLNESEINAVQTLRTQGKIPLPYNVLKPEEIKAFKEIVNFFIPESKESNMTMTDYANLYQSKENVQGVFTNPENWEIAAATAGGIIAPTVLPGVGQATLPARIGMLITKHPRLAKVVSAFMGGTGASAPLADSKMEALGYGLVEASGEGIIQGGVHLWKNKNILKKAIQSDMSTESKVALKQLESSGQILTPSIITDHQMIDTMENIASNAWWGGGTIKKARMGAVEASLKDLGDFAASKFVMKNPEVSKVTDDFVQGFLYNATDKNMDLVLKDFLTKGTTVQKALIKTGYRNVDTIVKKLTGNNQIVNIKGIKKFAELQLEGGLVDEASIELLQRIGTLSDNVSFTTAQQLRSQFLEMTGFYKSGKGTTGFSKAVAGTAQNILDGSMEKAIKNISKGNTSGLEAAQKLPINTKPTNKKVDLTQLMEAWRGANGIYKASKDTFQNALMTRIMNADPDKVYTSLIKGKHAIRIKDFRNLIFNTAVKDGVLPNKFAAEKLWRKVQGEFFVDMMGTSISSETKQLSASSLLGKLRTFSGRGDRALAELFHNSPQTLSDFKSFARTLELAQSKGIKGVPGGMFIQLMQAGAIAGIPSTVAVLGGGITWAAVSGVMSMGVLLGGPKAIANLFTNRNFIKGLTQTVRNEVGSHNYTRGALHVINAYLHQGMFTQEQAEQKVEEGVQVGALNKNALKTFASIQKRHDSEILKKQREDKIIKKVKQKTKEFAEWTGLS